MIYTKHAKQRMKRRGITEGDVAAVLASPTKIAPGDNSATNYWGYGPSGYRIRVTVAPNRLHIKTVTWADCRKQKKGDS
jgi:hypothetical protein